jgi:PAS domain S-box-containing protein
LRTFGPEDVQLLSLFAAQLGPALEAARLTDERHRLSVSLREFAVAVGGQASTARLGELACLQIRNLVGADQAATLLVGSDGKRLTVVATSGHEESADAHVPLEVGKGVVGQAVSTGRTRIINDYGAWAGRIGEVPPGEDVFSVMATPLIVDREPVGVIHAVVKGPKAHFDERQVEVIELIAAQVAPGLRVARLVEELEGQSRRLQTLHEVAVVAGGVLDPNGLAELVVGRAKELTGALAGDLLWWDPLSVSLRVWDKDLGFWSKAPAEGAAGVAFSTRRPVAADANPHDWRHLVLPPGSTALAVPLLVHDQPIGSLSLLFGSGSRIPSDAVDLLTMLAAQAAPALDAARLHSDLASSEQRYRAIFDKAFICISQTDLEGRCLDMNQAGLDMLGYTEHDVPTLWWNDILAPTEHEPGNLIARLCTSARDRYRGQRLCQRQDGTPFWGDLTASVLRDPTGQPTGAYVMLEDITERREAEDMATRLGRILDASAAEILIVDPATLAITQANRTACENLGWSFGELTEMRLPQLVATLSEAEILEIMRDLESSDKDEALYVGEHLRRDGSQYPVEVRLQASEVQRPPLILVIVHDISERLREEEARRETEAKSRFLASMSHELRTPLNSILGFAQLLARPGFGGLSDRQQRYLGHIESSGRHLLELINDVLDLSRLDAGQFRVDPVTVELGPMVQELIAKVRPLAGDRHLFLDVSVEEKVMVHADPLRLSQVIWNLLSNALKFTSDRGTIKIVAGRQGKMIFMTVADNGIGIPVDQQERIFEEFTQVDSGLSRNREGAGLGLTLSRRLVIAMGGSLTVASTAGEGSAFTVRLPAASVKRPRKSPKR